MKHHVFCIALPMVAAVAMTVASPTRAVAQERDAGSLGGAVIKLTRNTMGWMRILDSGALVALTVEEARALNLSSAATVGKVIHVLADDYWTSIKEIGTAGKYIGTDVVVPMTVKAYIFTADKALPATADAIGSAYEIGKPLAEDAYLYTKETIIPTAGAAAANAYEASKPRIAEALTRTGGYITGAGRGLRKLWKGY